jgi:uncharacterized protein YutE (UPF0331/DUF86 family)
MTPTTAKKRIVAQRADYILQMVSEIRDLPLESHEVFLSDKRNIWAAESCLRRALEALLDLGRHILAKCFAKGVTEYKQIAEELEKAKVLSGERASLLRTLAGYRNRMVHFYDEITPEELYAICHKELDDLLAIRKAYLDWIKANPEKVDETL